MPRIYFDNAATTFPKPPEVARAVYDYMTGQGASINRGCYGSAYQVEEQVFGTRELLCELFHGPDPRNVVFTPNATASLNLLLKGFLRRGDHVLVSAMEHNAVMRPLTQLLQEGVTFSRLQCDETGALRPGELERCLTPATRAVILTHASNVTGTVLPIEHVGRFCAERRLKFIVDAAQTAGVCPIHMEAMRIDALAFTGHKGLYGPQGIGGFLLTEDLARDVTPLLSGGTGSFSDREELPPVLPDRFEAGTPNLPGILGLRAGLLWLRETGLGAVRAHELALTERFLARLRPMEESGLLRVFGRRDASHRVGVVSLQTLTRPLSDAAAALDEDFGIETRVGLHCAPNAHKTIGSFPTGTIRFSFGFWNTAAEIDAAANALTRILS